jgi:hypothetical protein
VTIRRLAGIGVVAIVLLSLVTPLAAAPVTLAALAKADALVLQSQTPWVGAGGTFELRVAAPPPQNVAARDLEYAISIHPSSPSRSAFAKTLTTRPTTPPLAVTTIGVTEAATDENGSVTLDVGLQDPAQPRDRTRVGLRGAGVYPVAVELRSVGGAVHARLLTHLIFVPEAPTGPRLAVGVIVPLRAPVALQPSGADVLSTTDVTALANVATTLDHLPTPGVFLLPSPETLAALARNRDGDTRAAVEAMQQVAPAHTVIAAPFMPLDASAASAEDRVTARERGRAVSIAVLGVDPADDPVVVGDFRDDRVSAELPPRLVVRDTALQPSPQRVTTAEPVLVRRAATRAVTAPALVADSELSAHFSNAGSPVLAAHHLLADLATIYFDSPGRFRSIVVLPPDGWRPNAAILGPFLAGLASSPILEAGSVTRLFQLASKRTTPRTRVLLAQPTSSSGPSGMATVRRTVQSLRSVMAGAPAALQNLNDRLLIAESTALSEKARRTYVDDLAEAIAVERHRFQLPTGGSLTLTARRGAIPITIRSSANYPARVLLQVASDRLKFPGGNTRMITLSHHNTTERFVIQSIGSGAFPLRILLKSPDGKVLLSQSRLTVRSTNASGVGVGLSVGAGLFLVGWWIRHSRRRTIST